MEIALIGRKLGHSLSPEIHEYLGNYKYELCELEPEELDGFFSRGDFRGLNVTIPYKPEAARRCDKLSEFAQRIGCVNTVIRSNDGTLFGDNTDYYGFTYMASRAGIDFSGKKTLILGSGGASMTARTVAGDLGAREVIVISRSGEDNYGNIDRHSDAEIIVNCTPVGMFPNNGERIVDLGMFPKLEGVLDMIYNPLRTPLLIDAADRGIKNSNGLSMLVAQAAKSAEYFRRNENRRADMEYICREIENKQRNIVLIGMPGCGKTTVGRLLARELGRIFIDTDDGIETASGKSIPEIFSTEGEKAFRDLESKVVYEAGKGSGAVISTGGGAILRRENREALMGNSVVVFLERPVTDLATHGRPLSEKGREAIEKMYTERLPLYKKTADVTVRVGSEPRITAASIINKLEETR